MPTTSFTLLGIGAMNSPRYGPAGLLVERGRSRVAIDGGPGQTDGPLAAWLVTDHRAELIAALRIWPRLASSPRRSAPSMPTGHHAASGRPYFTSHLRVRQGEETELPGLVSGALGPGRYPD